MAKAADGARVDRSKAVVMAEVYRQLSSNGLAGFSIDEVARACGVSKTTIYRHWPTRSALIVDACSRLGQEADPPDTGDVAEDLRALLEAMASQLQEAGWSVVYPAIVDAAERDPSLAAMQEGLQRKFMAPFARVIERARRRGQLPETAVAADIVAAAVGPLFYRRWFSREPIGLDFIRQVTAAVLANAGLRRVD